MARSPRFWLMTVAIAFWPAMLLAFWLDSLSRPTTRLTQASVEASPPGVVGSAGPRTVSATGTRTRETTAPGNAVSPAVPARPADGPGAPSAAPASGLAPMASEPEDLGARDFAPGAIVELNYEFANETSRQEFEADQKARWEARKAVEIARVSEFLTRELALDSTQSARLRDLLHDESQRRVAVVDDLTAGRIDQTRFRRQVDSIRAEAAQELQSLFTAEQLAHYRTLEPRKQVLLDGSITGR